MQAQCGKWVVAVALVCLLMGVGVESVLAVEEGKRVVSVPAVEEGKRTVCPGTWELVYDGGWFVKQEDARVAVRFVTPVYGCSGDRLSLDREMSGMPVRVRCRLVETRDGEERRVEELTILCR